MKGVLGLLTVSTVYNQDIETVETQVNKAKVCNWVETQFNIYQGEPDILKSDEDHEPWLYKRREEIGGTTGMPAVLFDQRMPPVTVNKMHQVTDDILDLMNDPHNPGQWDTRGLVMAMCNQENSELCRTNHKGCGCRVQNHYVLAGLHKAWFPDPDEIDEGFIGRILDKVFFQRFYGVDNEDAWNIKCSVFHFS